MNDSHLSHISGSEMIHHSNSSEIDSGRRHEASCSFAVSWIIRRLLEIATRHSLDSCQRPGSLGAVLWASEAAVQSSLTRSLLPAVLQRWQPCGVLRCLALRGSQTRPVKAIPEIYAMAQSSSHVSFLLAQMPDALSELAR